MVMTTTSVDLPTMLHQYVKSEVEQGRFKSKAEAIRYMIRKDLERKHSVDEQLSQETLEKLRRARERDESGGWERH